MAKTKELTAEREQVKQATQHSRVILALLRSIADRDSGGLKDDVGGVLRDIVYRGNEVVKLCRRASADLSRARRQKAKWCKAGRPK